MNGRLSTTKMPNPRIAIAVGSYAGSLNIGDSITSPGRSSSKIHTRRRSWLRLPNSRDTAPKDMRTLRIGNAAKGRFTPHRRLQQYCHGARRDT
jgi:hypothetical protein